MNPMMQPREIKKIKLLISNKTIMLEYGSGGSTITYGGRVKKYFSIEHNKNWYNNVKSAIQKRGWNHISIYHVKENMKFKTPAPKEALLDYINYIDKIEDKDVRNLDVVLIDGRARIFCAEKVLDYIRDDTVVLIHDFNRERYQKALKWYRLVDKVATLGVLKKK